MPIRYLLACLVLMVGCSNTDPPAPASQTKVTSDPVEPVSVAESPVAETPAAEDTPSVTLSIKNSDETDHLIASQKGRFVVLDLWALW